MYFMLQTDKFCRKNCFSSERISFPSERISLERNESLTRERTCSSETNLSRAKRISFEQISIFLFLERINESHEPNKSIESLSSERISRLSLELTNLLNLSRANESLSSETNISRAKGLARAQRVSLVNKFLSFYF
jgi:hypothetical protein